VHIDFAYRTFRWDSEASLKAHVYCVIVGFSDMKTDTPKLFVISSILGITMLSVWIAFTKP